jgi:hypothetical protein
MPFWCSPTYAFLSQDTILTDAPEMKHHFFSSHGALALVQLLEVIRLPDLVCRILGVLNLLIYQDRSARESLPRRSDSRGDDIHIKAVQSRHPS